MAAGIYNIAWAAYSIIFPQSFFQFSGMAEINHPEMFQCLAMVIGLYGILYWQVARDLERGGVIAAIGLAGKILGPIGAMVLIYKGTWPLKSLILCFFNDFIWWGPFSYYLFELKRSKSR